MGKAASWELVGGWGPRPLQTFGISKLRNCHLENKFHNKIRANPLKNLDGQKDPGR